MTIESYFSAGKAVCDLLYPHAEVVIHDLKTGRIAAIFNNFSRRKVGEESLVEEAQKADELPDVFAPYTKVNWDGRTLKSTTATLRDKNGKAIGLFCINLDLSQWQLLQKMALSWLGAPVVMPEVLFKEDYREQINAYISTFLQKEGLTLKSLNREKTRDLIRALHADGAFKTKNAAVYIAEVLRLSRATIYNYLR